MDLIDKAINNPQNPIEFDIEDMWTNGPKKFENIDEYVNWFDASIDFKENYKMGYIDFYNRILTMDMYNYIGDPRDKSCLEIGFGGGRLLNASSRVFNQAFGVDILNNESINRTKVLLNDNGCNNVHLYNRKDINQIEDKSIDFVYSFIVIQHFSGWDMVEFYLKHIDRMLTDTGVGILYFGRNDFNDDDIYTKTPHLKGCSLYNKPEFIRNRLGEQFNVIEIGEITKAPWNNLRSGQFFAKFKR